MAAPPGNNNYVLFKELGKGSEDTLRRIYAFYYSLMVAYIFEAVADKELAKEIVMDSLQTLWENREAVAKMDNPEGWLFRCAHYKALKKLRAERRRNIIPIDDEVNLQSTVNIQGDMEYKEISRYIDAALNQLPAQQKRIVRLSREYGMNRKEIARHCGLSESTVKNHITGAFHNLRKIMKDIFRHYFI